jgi:hypothetical protein
LYEKRWYTSKGPQEFTSLCLKTLNKNMEVDNPPVGVKTAEIYWLLNVTVLNVTLVYKFI